MLRYLQRLLGESDEGSSIDACAECGESALPGAARCDDCLG
jgi:hypothetical protein